MRERRERDSPFQINKYRRGNGAAARGGGAAARAVRLGELRRAVDTDHRRGSRQRQRQLRRPVLLERPGEQQRERQQQQQQRRERQQQQQQRRELRRDPGDPVRGGGGGVGVGVVGPEEAAALGGAGSVGGGAGGGDGDGGRWGGGGGGGGERAAQVRGAEQQGGGVGVHFGHRAAEGDGGHRRGGAGVHVPRVRPRGGLLGPRLEGLRRDLARPFLRRVRRPRRRPAAAPEMVGSTAVVVILSGCQIIASNCGDSRAILCRGTQTIPLTVDQKPDRHDELTRIEETGGRVINWNGARVFGVLAMSRAIGDRYLRPWIIPVPEITFTTRRDEDECLILASDGLWDVMTNDEVGEVARRLLRRRRRLMMVDEISPAQAVADYLTEIAKGRNSSDNISIIVVDLKAKRKRQQRPHEG
ncbi:protein phosphatase 2C 51-like isoform X2 [Syzygium oleosum]|uniref:protein phosphatase 2C 51-like isoform X2 n=1 Tax=Syzygium oleosum TaxID=219896 RepID=UPI0024BA67F4|nr:protein phosphatase 2C 51-like isoform X2 [Syzygium oleosum]